MRPFYAIAALIVFAVEVAIAAFVHDGFVRPYVGDALVIGLIYLALRAVTPLKVVPAVAITVGFAFIVECAQAFNLIGALGLSHNKLARVILGNSFDLGDFAAYAVGGAGVLIIEHLLRSKPTA
jgi:hypothetical protein